MNINIQSSNTRSPPRYRTRAVALLLVISFVVGLAPAAFATGTEEEKFLELLDYGYVQHDDHFVSGNRTEIIDEDETVYFNLPYGLTMNYIDMVIYASNSVSTTVSAGLDAWGYYTLSVQQISTNLWRVYGSIPEHTYEKVEVKFSSSSTAGYVNFYSCRVGFTGLSSKYTDASISSDFGLSYAWVGNRYYSYTYTPSALDAMTDNPFNIQLVFPSWQAFDYIEVYFQFETEAITSIVATVASENAPVEVTYLENVIDYDENGYSRYTFRVTIDLTGVKRVSRNSCFLSISGRHIDNDRNQSELYGFLSCYGYTDIRYADPVLYWFQELAEIQKESLAKIDTIGNALEAMAGVVGNISVDTMNIMDILGNGFYPMFEEVRSYVQSIYEDLVDFKTNVNQWLTEIFMEIRTWGERLEQALTPNLSEHQESMDDAASQATEIQDAMQDMEQMERPDVDDIPSDITTIITGNEVIIATQGLGLLMMNPVLRELLTMAFTLALAAYVLFGKR